MPRIRLRVEEESSVNPCRFTDPGNPAAGVQVVPVLRLTTIARLEPPAGRTSAVRAVTALIDTGAWLTAIETPAWADFDRAGLVEHLPLDGPATRAAAVGGLTTAYRLGRLWISLHDLRVGQPSESLPAVPVLAQLLLNPRCRLPYPVVLGLHLGVLDGRRLTREVVAPPPGPRPPNRTTDCGPWFAQEWHLDAA